MPYYPPPASSSVMAYIHIVDSKSTGTDGGTFTSGAWRTRALNTEKADTGNNASLASDQITLAAGTYRCRISAPAWQVNRHQARLYNTTGSAVLLSGTTEIVGGGSGTNTRSIVAGRFTLSIQSVLEVQHQCQTTASTTGWGVASGGAGGFTVTEEIYTECAFWKE